MSCLLSDEKGWSGGDNICCSLMYLQKVCMYMYHCLSLFSGLLIWLYWNLPSCYLCSICSFCFVFPLSSFSAFFWISLLFLWFCFVSFVVLSVKTVMLFYLLLWGVYCSALTYHSQPSSDTVHLEYKNFIMVYIFISSFSPGL